MIRVLITGESGTIPMAMCKVNSTLAEPVVIVNSQLNNDYSLKHLKRHQSFKIREPELDILDQDLLFNDLAAFIHDSVDVVVHSAAYVGTDFCDSNPAESIMTNVKGTHNIVELCKKFDKKLIYFSTTAILDTKKYNEEERIDEDTPINPQTLYGITKYAGELAVTNLMNREPYPIVVRPVFGFGDYPHDLHSALTKLIYVIYCTTVKRQAIPLRILLDKDIKKSYTRVENIAWSVLSLIKQDCWNMPQLYHLGVNHTSAHNWFEIYDILRESFQKFGIVIKPKIGMYENVEFIPQSDYLHWHNIDNSVIRDKQLYKDFYTFEEGIERTIESVIENHHITPYWVKQ